MKKSSVGPGEPRAPNTVELALEFRRRQLDHPIAAAEEIDRIGQELAIGLAAGELRHLFDHVEKFGNHVVGQARAQRFGDRDAVEAVALIGDDIGRQFRNAGHLDDAHGGRTDRRLLEQNALDLRQFHPEAADLDLVVDAAHELQRALFRHADEVVRAVKTRRDHLAVERILDELLGCEFRPIEIAARHAQTADGEFSGLALGHRLHLLIDNVGHVARQRSANRHRLPGDAIGIGGDDRGFGRAVGVQHAPAVVDPTRNELRRTHFATHNEQADRRQIRLDHRQKRRHRREVGDPARADELGGVGRRTRHVLRRHTERAAEREGRPHFLHRGVERDREALIDAVFGGDPVDRLERLDESDRVAVLDHDAFGTTRGTGRVDHIAEIPVAVFADSRRRLPRGTHLDFGCVLVQKQQVRLRLRQTPSEFRIRHDRAHARVFENVVNTIDREFGVDRHIASAGFQDAQHGGEEFARFAVIEADQRTGLHAADAERPSDAVGLAVEFGIAQ